MNTTFKCILYRSLLLIMESPMFSESLACYKSVVKQVTIARVYNWDVHQRRVQLASTSVEDT